MERQSGRASAGDDRAMAVLRVGFVPGVTVSKWRRTWDERFPPWALDLVDVAASEQRDALDEHVVDMCFIRLPIDDQSLHVIPLYAEVPVVVVPRDHPVSLFDEVTSSDLSDETLLEDVPGVDPFDLVAGGAGVLVTPQSIARSRSRRDLVYRPVSDAPPTQVALAWLAENPHELIEELVGIVRGRTPNSSRGRSTALGSTGASTGTGGASSAPSSTHPSRRPPRPTGRRAPRRRR